MIKYGRYMGNLWAALRFWTVTQLLYLYYFLTRTPLVIGRIEVLQPFIIKGNPFTIGFDVKGCHKISIQGIGYIKGTQKDVTLQGLKTLEYIVLIFYGQKGSEFRTIKVDTVGVNFNRDLAPELGLKHIFIQSHNLRTGKIADVINGFRIRSHDLPQWTRIPVFNTRFSSAKLRMNSLKIIGIDTFAYENYKLTNPKT